MVTETHDGIATSHRLVTVPAPSPRSTRGAQRAAAAVPHAKRLKSLHRSIEFSVRSPCIHLKAYASIEA